MSELHPFFVNVFNDILDRDQREAMPKRKQRFEEMAKYITDDSELDTDILTRMGFGENTTFS